MAQGIAASTIGRKVAMAVSGVILFGFVLGHMVGNLQVFLGREAFNAYSEFLHHLVHGAGLWVVRAVLLAAVVVHIVAAVSLTLTNRRARPVGYRETKPEASTYASRTMVWSGPVILAFVIYHLLDLTVGTVNPGFVASDPYRNLVASFERPLVAGFYVIAVLGLCWHLKHGVWSMLQTLGVSHPRYDARRNAAATIFAVVCAVGFIVLPVAVQAGWVR